MQDFILKQTLWKASVPRGRDVQGYGVRYSTFNEAAAIGRYRHSQEKAGPA